MFGRDEKGRWWNENWTKNNLHLFGTQMKVGQTENEVKNIVGPTTKVFI